MATKIIKNLEKLFCFCSKWNAASRIWGSKTKWDIENDNEDELNNNINNIIQQHCARNNTARAQGEITPTDNTDLHRLNPCLIRDIRGKNK